ncbi:isochorismatase family protein [Brevundimonas diminuta]|uniref:Cysteine hydrolase n=1 Tax=Brevundimonas diminuta TaxID=293 RepID=A0A1Z3LVP1_BREDI|nr:isochorismatase family protein [Brevundimonas diminuta]ASD26226.1 cysteine hydrolase [Brevundimonas diminuta]
MTPLSRSALVLIDLQQGIFAGRGGADQDGADRRLNELCVVLASAAHRWVALGRPLILIQHAGPTGHRLALGSHGWTLRPEVDLPGARRIAKTACDAFHDTELAQSLSSQGVTGLVLGGCMTEFCIDTTCRSAVSRGFDVHLLSDGHSTVNGLIPADMIVAHHNATLDGLSAGTARLRLISSRDI